RQFAVTISASTLISAINALTMTPSRALVIFKSREGAGAHTHQREALPWWIFGLAGGFLTLAWGPVLLPLAWSGDYATTSGGSDLEKWAQRAIYFAPGLLAGLVLGWLIIRPVNLILGVFFRGFNY